MLDFLHHFNDCYGRETRYGHTNQSAGVLWIGREPFLLGAVDSFNSVDDYMKGCHVQLVMSAYVSFVSGFSYKMYIDSNCYDSQI
jgi:hypothetical protein